MSARAAPLSAVRRCTRLRSADGIAGRAASRAVRSTIASQSGSSVSVRSTARTTGIPLALVSTTIVFSRVALGFRSSTPSGTIAYVPGNLSADRAAISSVGAMSVSMRPSRRSRRFRALGMREALGVEERRRGGRLGLEERDVRQPGDAGVDPVHDVERAPLERCGDVRPHPDGNRHRAARRERERGGDHHHAAELALLERAPSCLEITRPGGRRQDDDVVPASSKSTRDAVDVLVGVVGLRPEVGGDEADSQGHRRPSLDGCPINSHCSTVAS